MNRKDQARVQEPESYPRTLELDMQLEKFEHNGKMPKRKAITDLCSETMHNHCNLFHMIITHIRINY